MSSVYFVHLTDTHIIHPDKGTLHSLEPDRKLRALFDDIRTLSIQPSFVVISGDLVEGGTVEDYRHFKNLINKQAEQMAIPVFVGLGNHDNRQSFRMAYLGESPSDKPYFYETMIGDIRLIMLDTLIPGKTEGRVGDTQLKWLADVLKSSAPGGTIIALHHPVLPTPTPRSAILLDRDELARTIVGSDVIGLLSGHIHCNSIGQFHGIASATGTSTAYGFDPTKVDSLRVIDSSGYNFIHVKDNNMLVHPMAMPDTHKEVYHLKLDGSVLHTAKLENRQRHIQLEGVYNLRDLGGYPTHEGYTTRWGTIFRSDNLHRISLSTKQKLIESGLRTVIDLRRSNEISKADHGFSKSDEVAYYNFSLQNIMPFEKGNVLFPNLTAMYMHIIDAHAEVIKSVLQTIIDSDGIALFHCAIGKDRTGVVAGLLLDIAGVPHEIIAEDYALSRKFLDPIMPEILENRPEHLSIEMFQHFADSKPETMMDMLSHLLAKYGGSHAYLQANGFDKAKIDTLRAKLIS